MPILGALIAALFGGLASWLVKVLTMRWALLMAGWAAFAALFVTLWAALATAESALFVAFPGSIWMGLVWAVVPPGLPVIVASVVAGEVAIALYHQAMLKVRSAMMLGT